MKKKFYGALLGIALLAAPGCAKNTPEISAASRLTGLWSQYLFQYKAYKDAQVIQEYSEAIAADQQITIQFFEDGTFETFERDLADGDWIVSGHEKGSYTYAPATGMISMKSSDGETYSDAKVLLLNDQKLHFSQTVSPVADNSEADKEEFISSFNKIR